MFERTLKILVIEDDPLSAGILKGTLNKQKQIPVSMDWATSRGQAELILQHPTPPDLVILDLSLPDCQMPDSLLFLEELSRQFPVVIISGDDDLSAARDTMAHGAQDYLVKGHFNPSVLGRSILFSYERYRSQVRLKSRAYMDEETGLPNRQYFMSAAAREIQTTHTSGTQHILLLFRPRRGEGASGERNLSPAAMRQVVDSFRECFRSSDLLARVGINMLAALAIDSKSHSPEEFKARLVNRLERDLKVNGSIGASAADPDEPVTFEQLWAEAEEDLAESAAAAAEDTRSGLWRRVTGSDFSDTIPGSNPPVEDRPESD